MFATPFQRFLANLGGLLPPTALYYLPKEEAYRRLKELSGQDFGHDYKLWEKWGLEHDEFLPGYKPSGTEDD